MSFHEERNPDEDEELAAALDEDVDDVLGEALDLAALVTADLEKSAPGGLFAYIREVRRLAVNALRDFHLMDAYDPATFRKLQMNFAVYKNAVEFAQNAVTGYITHQEGAGAPDDGAPD